VALRAAVIIGGMTETPPCSKRGQPQLVGAGDPVPWRFVLVLPPLLIAVPLALHAVFELLWPSGRGNGFGFALPCSFFVVWCVGARHWKWAFGSAMVVFVLAAGLLKLLLTGVLPPAWVQPGAAAVGGWVACATFVWVTHGSPRPQPPPTPGA
jgi:hypothetical protein